MCQYHAKFTKLLEELSAQRAVLTKELSRFDKRISNLYHELEKVEPSEDFALSFVQQLHDALKKRRVIKDELARLDAVLRPINGISEDIKTSVKQRKAVSKRWKQKFKISLSLEEIISNN